MLRRGHQPGKETKDCANAQGDGNFDGDLFNENRHGSHSHWSHSRIDYAEGGSHHLPTVGFLCCAPARTLDFPMAFQLAALSRPPVAHQDRPVPEWSDGTTGVDAIVIRMSKRDRA
jgi:hypothetical protein